jgi:hypothetical protein
MTEKQQVYEMVANALIFFAEKDTQLFEISSPQWHQVREIDDWLVQYREDDRVGVEQYERVARKLLCLYGVTA